MTVVSLHFLRVNLFDANGIAEDKESVLLTVIRPENYLLIRGLVLPVKPKDKTFAQLEEVLKGHFEPKALVIAERFRFYQRSQAPEETVDNFVASLRKLATNC